MYDLSRETRDNWEIPRSEIELSKQLGAGNFGEVWQGLDYRIYACMPHLRLNILLLDVY